MDWRIELPYATFGITVVDGVVTQAAPIARWMVGKPWIDCRRWVLSKGGHGEPSYPPIPERPVERGPEGSYEDMKAIDDARRRRRRD